MDLEKYFSKSLLERFQELDDKLDDADLQGPNTTSKEDIEETKKGECFSKEANEYLDIQKKLTSFLLSEVIDRVELKDRFDVFLETNQYKILPFCILVKGLEGKVIRGKPFGQYGPNQNPEEYIEQEIEEVKKKVELL